MDIFSRADGDSGEERSGIDWIVLERNLLYLG